MIREMSLSKQKLELIDKKIICVIDGYLREEAKKSALNKIIPTRISSGKSRKRRIRKRRKSRG